MDVSGWCAERLGSPVIVTLFQTGHLSQVTAVRLADERRVVVKVRPWSSRLTACQRVQRSLWEIGFCCPEPLGSLERIGDEAWSTEVYVEAWQQLDPAMSGAASRYANLLAEMIESARSLTVGPPGLLPSLPWVGWDHNGDGLWPERDDPGASIHDLAGPDWLDDAAARAREFLRSVSTDWPRVVGHGDFESQNIRWDGDTALVVHDWDSVIVQPESTIVGAASAVWAAGGQPGGASTVEQSANFLAAYEQQRERPWSPEERRAAWAAGIWVRAFNAKKDAADGGGPQFHLFRHEAKARLHNAGLGG